MIRRLLPFALLPLAILATGLAAAPWLRAYPSDVLAVPLFGAAVLSVLTPLIVVGVGLRRLWATALIDVAVFVFYTLLVALHAPVGLDQLWTGLIHGPSQILTYALPLVSPRSLLVAPVALTWLAGAIIGECVARTWQSVVPYAVMLISFGLAYAGTARAISSVATGRRYDTLLAGLLLLTLLLMRATQTWTAQDRGAVDTGQVGGRLPMRGLVIGTLVSLVVAVAAAGAVQSSSFSGQPVTPGRVPPVNRNEPLTPVDFVAGLRPADPTAKGTPVFTVSVDRTTSRYVALGSVDTYDGSGWTFDRTFLPSGGVIPADADPTLRPSTAPVDQQYTISPGPLAGSPWLPTLPRVAKVTGVGIDSNAESGMVVPASDLAAGTSYSVTSTTAPTSFRQLKSTSLPSLSGDATDIQLPGNVDSQLSSLVQTLATETGVPSSQPVAYLQAVAALFHDNYSLSGAPVTSSSGATSPAPASGTATTASVGVSGGTGFADVLTSIRQDHSATPEQYATLIALIARKIGVRAELQSGFRIGEPATGNATATIGAGRYTVTTAEAWTWVQVPITGVGWVVLDGSPGTFSAPKSPSATAAASTSQPPTPTQSVQISKPNNQEGAGHAVAPRSAVNHDAGLTLLDTVWIVLAAFGLLLVLALVMLVIRKRLRLRRRRGVGDPRRRLIGAWQETLDMLVESGLPQLTALTSAEVTAATSERFGADSAGLVRALGESANAALFGPASWISGPDADSAWRTQRLVRRTVRRRLDLRARVAASLRYHRDPRVAVAGGPASWIEEARRRASSGVTGRKRSAGGRRGGGGTAPRSSSRRRGGHAR